jgi:hypothetical protein
MAFDPRLLGRYIEIRAGLPGPGAIGRSWNELKAAFSVKKDVRTGPNKATVKLWNLRGDSIEFLSQRGIVMQVIAGYRSLPSQVFSGDIINVETVPGPPNRVTTIKLGDGELAYARAEFNRSFGLGTDANKVFAAIAIEMGLGLGSIPLFPPRVFPAGVTFLGTARAALDRVTRDIGASWSIQDGFLQILIGSAGSGSQGAFLSSDTGLLSVDRIKDSSTRYRIRAQLQPNLQPGRFISVQSKEVIGVFVIRVAELACDNEEGEFVSVLEVSPP